MNEILQKRIEEAAKNSITETLMSTPNYEFSPKATDMLECAYIKGAEDIINNQWISVDEGLPTEKQIIAKLSKTFCGKDDCIEILYHIAKEHIDLRHPDWYYDCCGESVPTSAITHWMLIPSLKGGE